MKKIITSWNFKLEPDKWSILYCFLFVNLFAVAQVSSNPIVVENVYPRRITTNSKVTISGLPLELQGTGTIDKIICEGIYRLEPPIPPDGIFERSSDGTKAVMTIKKNDLSPIGNPTVNDVELRPLLINNQSVHTASPPSIENQVYLEYVAPKDLTLRGASDYLVNEIFTNWDYDGRGFWSSEDAMLPGSENLGGAQKNEKSPNNLHRLLGYRVGHWPGDPLTGNNRNRKPEGTIYSTGVDDGLLERELVHREILTQGEIDGQIGYKRGTFKAYSTFGINGKIESTTDIGKSPYLVAADLIDGVEGIDEAATDDDLSSLEEIYELTVFDAISDGDHGLELGTAVANFSTSTEVQFYSGNGKPGAVGDGMPDLLITQMADAGAGDIYYYADENGDIVGRPVFFQVANGNFKTRLAYWRTDTYSYPNGDFATATPNKRAFTDSRDEYKSLWMAAYKLEDFNITTGAQVESIETIVMNAGGAADMAFMAYNQETFNLQGPMVIPLLTAYVCRKDEAFSVTFELLEGTNVGVYDNGILRAPTDETEELHYQWYKNNILIPGEADNLLTINNVTEDPFGTYKVKIGNADGNIIMRVDLLEGGVPTYWDGTTWELSPAYQTAGYVVDDRDRGLVFASDYNEDTDLEGCDCYIAAGAEVTIMEDKTLKLHGAITVAPEVEASEFVSELPAGTFTLANNASLIQTKNISENQNRGNILVKRVAKNLKKYDYVYWSSPVENFKINDIEGSRRYEWDATIDNENGSYGNWIDPLNEGVMAISKGYIVRVPNSYPETEPYEPFQQLFEGVPNNGDYVINLESTPLAADNDASSQHWNLVGNPYPSAINAETFLLDNQEVISEIQIWTHEHAINETAADPFYEGFKYNYNITDYILFNNTASSDPDFNGFIASGQGIMVKAVDEGILEFNNSMRLETKPDSYDNSGFYRGTGSETKAVESAEKQLIWLSLSDDAKNATLAVVGYVKGATNKFDPLFDATSGDGAMRLYSIVENREVLIQGREFPFQEDDKVVLGIDITKNGIYSLGIEQLKGDLMVNESQCIFIEDTYTGKVHNIKNSPYSFTSNTGKFKDRFILRYTDNQISVEDQRISTTFVYISNNQLFIKASKPIELVDIYDLTGKKIMDYNLDGQSSSFKVAFSFPHGAYLTKIKLNDHSVVTKKFIY